MQGLRAAVDLSEEFLDLGAGSPAQCLASHFCGPYGVAVVETAGAEAS
jgi:hypothetical protein